MDMFTNYEMENKEYFLTQKINKIKAKLNHDMKIFKIPNFEKKSTTQENTNFFLYIKNAANLNYIKRNYLKILKDKFLNVINKNELAKIRKRKYSHDVPYHLKTYHLLIYRNFDNFKYKPFLFPLEEKDRKRKCLTIEKQKKVKRRKINYINKYSEQTVNLVKKYIKLNPKKNINSPLMNRFSSLSPFNFFGSGYFNKMSIIQKNNFDEIETAIKKKFQEKSHNNLFLPSLKKKRNNRHILPKIKSDCLVTLKNSNLIANNLMSIKLSTKDKAKENKTKKIKIFDLISVRNSKNRKTHIFERYANNISSPMKYHQIK